jgi:hypothetical protein
MRNMSRYKEMNTEPLIKEMVSLCLEVPPELAQEIASREDAISYLRDILQNEKYWNHGGLGDAWAPYHVIHILPLIKTKEALELLFETMRDETDLLGDWTTESTPTLLAAFGESAIERLKEHVLDETLDLYIRGSIATALNVIAHQHPDKKEEIKAFLSKLLEDTNDPTFAAFLIDELISFKDPNLLPQVRKAFEDGKIDTEVISRYDVDWVFNLPEEEQSYSKFMKSPLEHFSRENISYLKKISYIESKTPKKSNMKKIGRNDPCPCGSGKKYKKCCMKM